MEDPKERLKAILAILLSVNVLEYHDKNWLSGDNKTRNEDVGELLMEAADIVEEL